MLLSIAALKGYTLIQLNVNNAFLNEDLEEELYLQLPQGYTPIEKINPKVRFACKLQKITL